MKRVKITLLGHKDHGKSTLLGRLLYDTKSIMEDRIQEVKQDSQNLDKPIEYAFLLDSFEEERKHGMTIDIIHAQVKGENRIYDCIDVPGHKELIKNMLSGASQADAGILIVSAKEGIEEQTGQHLRLAHWLGLDRLIIAINKMDLIGYDQRVFEEMKRKTSALIGSASRGKVTYIPISAYEGENVVRQSVHTKWYSGQTLYECMENLVVQGSSIQGPLRIPIQDLYWGANRERIIVGRVESGSIQVGQTVFFALCGVTATVRKILSNNKNTATACAGENVGIVCDTDLSSLKRGDVCHSSDGLLTPKKEVLAHAIFLEQVPQQATVECGTAQTDCEITCLSSAEVGEATQIVLQFREPMIVERSKTAIGRLALKQQGKIIGAAVVI